jgi:tRNA uridine 5-carbamoylmethylation protein Kti12
MKLIFIYGPPASGKLTIANELSRLTEVPIFHNHITFDLAKSIYEIWSYEFFKYCEELRLDAFERAIDAGFENLIFTFCFNYPDDLEFVQKTISAVEKHNGSVCFVQLKSSKEALEKRVVNDERKKYAKLSSVAELRDFLSKYDPFRVIPDSNSLAIEADRTSPTVAACLIKETYKLGIEK